MSTASSSDPAFTPLVPPVLRPVWERGPTLLSLLGQRHAHWTADGVAHIHTTWIPGIPERVALLIGPTQGAILHRHCGAEFARAVAQASYDGVNEWAVIDLDARPDVADVVRFGEIWPVLGPTAAWGHQ